MPKKLRIAQLILPWIPLPPQKYGGTERIVSFLTEGLVKRGHDVTLFSTGDSKTSAKLEFVFKKALGLQPNVFKTLGSSFYPLMHVANCFEMWEKFDIIHSHAQFLGLPFAPIVKTPSLHTFHISFDTANAELKDLLARYKHLNFTSLSNAQRVPDLNFVKTVYNGVDTQKFKPLTGAKRDYLFWTGRLTDKKGAGEAIQVAKNLKIPLILAGKITDEEFYKAHIEKEIDGKLIRYVGELTEEEMIGYYQNAKLLLAPVKWNEPFGLMLTEAMACGTPVVAFANGAIPEVIKDNATGFVVPQTAGANGLTEAAKKIYALPDAEYQSMADNCRQHVENNFTLDKMVDGYESLYHQLIAKNE